MSASNSTIDSYSDLPDTAEYVVFKPSGRVVPARRRPRNTVQAIPSRKPIDGRVRPIVLLNDEQWMRDYFSKFNETDKNPMTGEGTIWVKRGRLRQLVNYCLASSVQVAVSREYAVDWVPLRRI